MSARYYRDGDDVVHEDAAELPPEDAPDGGDDDEPTEPATEPGERGEATGVQEQAVPVVTETDGERASRLAAAAAAKAAADRREAARLRAALQASHRQQEAEISRRYDNLRAVSAPPDLPSRESIHRALLCCDPDTATTLGKLAAQDAEPLAENEIVSLRSDDLLARAEAAARDGRLVLVVVPNLGLDEVGDTMLGWAAHTSARVWWTRERHAVHVMRGAHAGVWNLPPIDQAHAEYEAAWDRDLWTAAAGVRRWLEQAHLVHLDPATCTATLTKRRKTMEREQAARERAMRLALLDGHAPAAMSLRQMAELMPSRPMLLPAFRLPAGGLAMMYGPPGSGKSMVARAITMSLVTGADLFGCPTRTAPVVYVALEDPDGTRNAFEVAAGPERHRPDSVWEDRLRVATVPPPLVDRADIDRWCDEVAPDGAGLVVVDTWAHAMGAADLDETQGLNRAMLGLARIRARTGAGVLLLHHPARGSKHERSGGALRAACDMVVPVACELNAPGRHVVRLSIANRDTAKTRQGATPQHDMLVTFESRDGTMQLSGYADSSATKPTSTRGGRPSSVPKILDALSRADGPMGLDAIVAAVGCGKGTASRNLAALVRSGAADLMVQGGTMLWRPAAAGSATPQPVADSRSVSPPCTGGNETERRGIGGNGGFETKRNAAKS